MVAVTSLCLLVSKLSIRAFQSLMALKKKKKNTKNVSASKNV